MNIHSPKPKQNARKLFSYLHRFLDREKMMEEYGDISIKVYEDGMKYFEELFGNASYVNLEDYDITLLMKLRSNAKSTEELAEELSTHTRKIQAHVTKLLSKGLIISYISKIERKKYTFYQLTEYGNKRLIEELESE